MPGGMGGGRNSGGVRTDIGTSSVGKGAVPLLLFIQPFLAASERAADCALRVCQAFFAARDRFLLGFAAFEGLCRGIVGVGFIAFRR